MSSSHVAVVAEQDEGKLANIARELCTAARELADTLQTGVTAYLIGGQGIGACAEELIQYGADRVLVVEDRRLRFYDTLPYERVVADLIRKSEPQIVLYGATPVGRDLAPRIASELRVGLTADCTDLQIGDHKIKGTQYENILLQIRPAWGGNTIATIVSPDHRPQMATVRAGVMKVGKPDESRTGEVEQVESVAQTDDFVMKVVERVSSVKKVDLSTANVIVAGGAGVGSVEGFKLIEELANTLGGVVGASRAAVDGGFVDHDYQVGQTGTTVRPKLYIACGISGAIQHRAGMMEAGKIVAINNDASAPIFSVAHYGIVGDLHQVLPRLIKAYKSKSETELSASAQAD
jgi:electron transfer flavoprotein alpha subunit